MTKGGNSSLSVSYTRFVPVFVHCFYTVTTSICMPACQQCMPAWEYSHPAKISNNFKVVVMTHVSFPIDIKCSIITWALQTMALPAKCLRLCSTWQGQGLWYVCGHKMTAALNWPLLYIWASFQLSEERWIKFLEDPFWHGSTPLSHDRKKTVSHNFLVRFFLPCAFFWKVFIPRWTTKKLMT